jgi:hypothetical protein
MGFASINMGYKVKKQRSKSVNQHTSNLYCGVHHRFLIDLNFENGMTKASNARIQKGIG